MHLRSIKRFDRKVHSRRTRLVLERALGADVIAALKRSVNHGVRVHPKVQPRSCWGLVANQIGLWRIELLLRSTQKLQHTDAPQFLTRASRTGSRLCVTRFQANE